MFNTIPMWEISNLPLRFHKNLEPWENMHMDPEGEINSLQYLKKKKRISNVKDHSMQRYVHI